MAITVNYAPAASGYGQAGFMAGRGQYATNERQYRDKMRLEVEQLLQRERMQGRQIQASRANTRDQIAGNLISQQAGIAADERELAFRQAAAERQAAFDFVSGQRNRFQEAQLKSALGAQQAYQQNWLYGQSDQREMQMGLFQNQLEMQQIQAEADERLSLARQQVAQKRQAIQEGTRLKVQAAQQAIDSGQINRTEGQNYINQLEAEGVNQMYGITTETEFPEGMTPQQETAMAFKNETYLDDFGQRWVRVDGDWKKESDPPEPQPSPEQQQAMEERKVALDAFKVEMDAYTKEMSERGSELREMIKERTEQWRGMNPSETGIPMPVPENIAEQISRSAEADLARRWPVAEKPISPMQNYVEAPAGQGQFSAPVPSQPQPGTAPPQQPPVEQPVMEAAAPVQQAAPAQVVNDHWAYDREVSADISPEDRPYIDSFSDLATPGGQVRPPANLTAAELLNIGSKLNTRQRIMEIPEPSQPLVASLKAVSDRLAAKGRSKFEMNAIQQALSKVAGACASYGPDDSLWPKPVLAEIAAERVMVEEAVNEVTGETNAR